MAEPRKRKPPRTATVIRSAMVTPHMLRVTLGGPGLADFPDDQNSAYIKLMLTKPAPDSDEKPLIRTYTVRNFDPVTSELDVDFVLHDVTGPAVEWANSVSPGDEIPLMGPGPKKLVDHSADWFLLAGDMSALPAISANIEGMPEDAKGHAFLEIIDDADRQEFDAPANLQLHWIVNPHPDRKNSVLLDAVKEVEWLDGRPSVWVAGEFSSALAIRAYCKKERGVSRHDLYASSYWKMGESEDQHRVSKRDAPGD
jgi:NADPH-dependent ferric siderophore reductase